MGMMVLDRDLLQAFSAQCILGGEVSGMVIKGNCLRLYLEDTLQVMDGPLEIGQGFVILEISEVLTEKGILAFV
jgi:hypothetical protein